MAVAFGLDYMSQAAFERTANCVYVIEHHFFIVNHPKAVQAARDFYIRNKLAVPDRRGIIDIEISLDGAYSVKGHESTYCISCAIEVWTNRVIDSEITVKCFSCKDHNILGTYCPKGEFHGPTGNMESHNAEVLFRRSVKDFRVRYTKYVSDGDAKIFKLIRDMKPYGRHHPVEKQECANHLSKRAHKMLRNFTENWTIALGKSRKEEYKQKLHRYNNRGTRKFKKT